MTAFIISLGITFVIFVVCIILFVFGAVRLNKGDDDDER